MGDPSLPTSVTTLEVDGRTIHLVGTAHVSEESVEDVRRTVESVHPDAIAVELCPSRHRTLTDAEAWRRMDILKILKEGKAVLLLTQLALSSFYRRIGEKLGVQPGAEMLEGIRLAEQTGASLVLADRDIQITFKRVWGYLGFWSKCKLLAHLLAALFETDQLDSRAVEDLKKRDELESIMSEFAERFPQIKRRLIDERDIYLAQKIRRARSRTLVAVVGAGHVEGITRHIREDRSLDDLEQLPPKSIVPRLIGWGVPLVLVGLMAYGFVRGPDQGWANVLIFILGTGVLSALGAALAWAHPLAVGTAFLAAPIGILHPLLATGWFAGLAQAWIRRPTVDDFEDLPNTLSSFREFWTNPVTKVLLVTALTNVGATLGMLIVVPWIVARTM
ncbi:MAG: TraB/GumN family protein [Phycisphaerae bacterium]|nr:TraB/GumN family protein [Phycisphaerae bacterium]